MKNYLLVFLGSALGGVSRYFISNLVFLFLPALDNIFTQANNGGLITIEKADIIKYTKTEK